jgi:hypothetical protein
MVGTEGAQQRRIGVGIPLEPAVEIVAECTAPVDFVDYLEHGAGTESADALDQPLTPQTALRLRVKGILSRRP